MKKPNRIQFLQILIRKRHQQFLPLRDATPSAREKLLALPRCAAILKKGNCRYREAPRWLKELFTAATL